MKILAVNWRDPLHPEAGGAEVHLDKILSHLAKNHQVVLVSTRTGSESETYTHNGYTVRKEGHPFLFNFTFKNMWQTALSKENFDIVIDDISKIGLQTPGYIKDTPVVSIFHHIHGKTLFSLLPYPTALYVYNMERLALKAYRDAPLVVVSESSRDDLQSLYKFSDITVLHNGIDKEYLLL